MTLLLLMLYTVGAPVPPPQEPYVKAAAVTQEIQLLWTASITPGCSNVLYWGYTLDRLENRLDCGTNTTARALVSPEVKQYFTVRAVLNGVESENSNVIMYPPKVVDRVYAQRDGQDIGVLDTWTNQPTAPMATYRLRIERALSYEP